MSLVQGIHSVPTELMSPLHRVRDILRGSVKKLAFNVAFFVTPSNLITHSVYDDRFSGAHQNCGFGVNCL